jgi:hypothetical protein
VNSGDQEEVARLKRLLDYVLGARIADPLPNPR